MEKLNALLRFWNLRIHSEKVFASFSMSAASFPPLCFAVCAHTPLVAIISTQNYILTAYMLTEWWIHTYTEYFTYTHFNARPSRSSVRHFSSTPSKTRTDTHTHQHPHFASERHVGYSVSPKHKVSTKHTVGRRCVRSPQPTRISVK